MSMQGSGLKLTASNKIYQLGTKFKSIPSLPTDNQIRHRTRNHKDQLVTPQCVGVGTYHYLRSTPQAIRTPLTHTDIYFGAQRFDEWPGENYEGTSVSGAMNFLMNHPAVDINSFDKIEDIYSLLHYLAKRPVIAGTEWFEDMFTPNEKGIIHVSGQSVGGHAYLLVGYRLIFSGPAKSILSWDKSYIEILNSWGPKWSVLGPFARIPLGEFKKLFNSYSEFVAPVKVL